MNHTKLLQDLSLWENTVRRQLEVAVAGACFHIGYCSLRILWEKTMGWWPAGTGLGAWFHIGFVSLHVLCENTKLNRGFHEAPVLRFPIGQQNYIILYEISTAD
jgi:hypothetical protein